MVYLFFTKRRNLLIWQILFLVVGTSWLWAPHLNQALSYRTSLISQYETAFQPYSWLFRTCDVLAGLLLFVFSLSVLKSNRRLAGYLLLAISIGLMADPLFSTTCRPVGDICKEYISPNYILHAVETVATSLLFFVIAAYDGYSRKKLTSFIFAGFQVLYGLLFVSQLAHKDSFNTATQFIYELTVFVWLAWYCRDLMAEHRFKTSLVEMSFVKNAIAAWAFINGILAIIISLAHIRLFGDIRGLYFTGDSAWLAQHGIIVGVIMIYLSRHLARGEARARQIFLLLIGAEAIKYASISPDADLLFIYLTTFVLFFVLRDDFDRGTIALTWKVRLRDLYVLVLGLLISAFVSLLVLDRDDRVSSVTNRAVSHFRDYVIHTRPVMLHRHLESELLAHSISAFLLASLAAILWVLFRPYKTKHAPKDWQKIEQALKKYSSSTEDFFKLWPADKDYFWGSTKQGFVAYKVVGPIAFALADPIGPKQALLIKEFNDWSRQHRLSACYLPVYPASLPAYEQSGLESLQIGSSALIKIDDFMNNTSKDKWWRWRINKTQKAGYTYHASHPPHSKEFLADIRRVSNAWLKTGGHVERGFGLGYFNTEYLQRCTIHYLRDSENKILAFTNQLPQFKKSKTLTVDMLRSIPGTDAMPYLLYKMIEGAESEYSHFDLGFVPFAKTKEPIVKVAKALSGDRFSARGLEQFKNKFDPSWQSIYLAYDGDLGDLASIAINIEKAMSLD